MSDTSLHPPSHQAHGFHNRSDGPNVFVRAENWLDGKGRAAWIAVMVLAFIFVWPVGLALLAYMIWSKRMFSHSCRTTSRHSYRSAARAAFRTSGNTAFDAYKADTLRRLEDEQASFEAFLERLREAKDKSEFDQFMTERSARKDTPAEGSDDANDEPAKGSDA